MNHGQALEVAMVELDGTTVNGSKNIIKNDSGYVGVGTTQPHWPILRTKGDNGT